MIMKPDLPPTPVRGIILTLPIYQSISHYISLENTHLYIIMNKYIQTRTEQM